jgi:hypothetical protein
MAKPKKSITFDFVIDYLAPLDPIVKPFFGSHAIYVGEKLMFILRNKNNNTDCNGVWISTSHEHHKSLKKDFPSLCSVAVLNDRRKDSETNWQMLRAQDDDFEPMVIKACELVLHKDPRIGKVPKPKKKKRK